MTKEKKADEYIQNNSSNIIEIVKTAYMKGFEDGIAQSVAKIKIDGVEYVDLGLPSGTLWSVYPLGYGGFYNKYSYYDALKYNIPTVEEYNELSRYCKCASNNYCTDIKGGNGKYININTYFHYLGEGVPDGNNYFWLKSEVVDNMASVGCVQRGIPDVHKGIKHFTGYSLPIIIVKRKE